MPARLILILCFITAIDLYALQAILTIAGGGWTVLLPWFSLTVLSLLSMYLFFAFSARERLGWSRQLVAAASFITLMPKVFIALLLIPEDIYRLGLSLILVISGLFTEMPDWHTGRSEVWSWVAITASLSMMTLFLYGALFNVYKYRVRHIGLKAIRLPQVFSGLKVIQISDIHSGSLSSKDGVQKAVDRINAQQPDLVFFTGDLVNNIADEALFLQDVFSGIQARLGVFSVLGNHDYGDYVAWPSEREKAANLSKLKRIHADMGWRLLMNEHVMIQHEGQQIAVAGVENWSASDRFPKYGKLDTALHGIDPNTPVLLLSHDPSHWEAEVLDHPAYIMATFSGHTHGMQFGFEWGRFRWSPVQYVYKQWAGLYAKADRYLYVNRGFGVLGYPGRVGILPEITVFTLQHVPASE